MKKGIDLMAMIQGTEIQVEKEENEDETAADQGTSHEEKPSGRK